MGESPLPAEPLTVARFLAAHPAAAETQRRRVGAINAAHRKSTYAPPGRAQVVRDIIDQRRRQRMRQRRDAAAQAIPRLPSEGWPTALFARRDAMLLALYAAGLSAVEIATLRLGDVRAAAVKPCTLEIMAGDHQRTVTVDRDAAGSSATQIHRRWAQIRQVQNQLPATRWVRWLLDGQPMPPLRPAPEALPLLTPLDRWGATPLISTALSADSVAAIIRSHLAGTAPAHRPLRTRPAVVELPQAPEATETDLPPLDPDTVTRGLEARRRSADLLDGVTDALDDVEARAEQLLAGLLELLEEPELPRSD